MTAATEPPPFAEAAGRVRAGADHHAEARGPGRPP